MHSFYPTEFGFGIKIFLSCLHLYNYVLEKSPKLQKIVVVFSYEEILNERASMGHGLTAEYDVRGKKLVKLKRVKE